MLVIKENKLSGAADRARQARRGRGFHTEPSIIPHPVFGLLFGKSLMVASLYQYWFPTHFRQLIRTCFEQGPLVGSNLESDVNIA